MVEKGDGKRVKEGDGKKCKKVALPTTLSPNKPTPTQNYFPRQAFNHGKPRLCYNTHAASKDVCPPLQMALRDALGVHR